MAKCPACPRPPLTQADGLLLATDHDANDHGFTLQHARLIVNTRDYFSAAVGKLYKA